MKNRSLLHLKSIQTLNLIHNNKLSQNLPLTKCKQYAQLNFPMHDQPYYGQITTLKLTEQNKKLRIYLLKINNTLKNQIEKRMAKSQRNQQNLFRQRHSILIKEFQNNKKIISNYMFEYQNLKKRQQQIKSLNLNAQIYKVAEKRLNIEEQIKLIKRGNHIRGKQLVSDNQIIKNIKDLQKEIVIESQKRHIKYENCKKIKTQMQQYKNIQQIDNHHPEAQKIAQEMQKLIQKKNLLAEQLTKINNRYHQVYSIKQAQLNRIGQRIRRNVNLIKKVESQLISSNSQIIELNAGFQQKRRFKTESNHDGDRYTYYIQNKFSSQMNNNSQNMLKKEYNSDQKYQKETTRSKFSNKIKIFHTEC